MIFLGAPNDPGVFGSWLLSCWQSDNSICNVSVGANWTCCVGLLSLLASIVMGADSIGPWVVNSTCSEGQVVGRRAVRAGPNV